MEKGIKGCLLPALIVFVIFFIAAVIFTTNYDSNETEYQTVKGITPMMITPLLGNMERQFGYEMREEETVTGANRYYFEKNNDRIELTLKYELADKIGLGLLVLKCYYPQDSSLSNAAKYLAMEIVSLPYHGSKPDSAIQWMKASFNEERAEFSAGNGEFIWSNTIIGDHGKKLALRGIKK